MCCCLLSVPFTTCCLWLLHVTMAELSSGQREYDVQGKIFTILPFNKKVASARKEDVQKISKMGILK